MAIVNIQSYTGMMYQFDDVLQKFIMNPNNDAGLLSLTGWNSTALSIQELSDLHNGTSLFTGRSDYSGDPQKFPIMILAQHGIITNSTQIKVRVDRDPAMTYTGESVLYINTLPDNPADPSQVYYDAPFDVYQGSVYAISGQTERWFFDKSAAGSIVPQTLSFTDTDTGRSATSLPIQIDFRQPLSGLRINEGLVADLKFAPYYETVADTTITPKMDNQSGVSIALTGSGTNKLTYDPDQPNSGSLSRRFYNGQTMYQRERAWWINNGDDFVPTIRYETNYNGVDDKIEIIGSGSWLPTTADWTYHITDRVTTLGIGTLLSKGINGSGNETEINMSATGELSLIYGGVSCGVIATQEADIYNFITLKYDSTAKAITVWYDAEVLIDAFDVSLAQDNTSTIVRHCRRIGASTFDNFLDGYSHHDRYYNKMFDNKHKDMFFYNVYFSVMIPFSADSTGGGVYRYLNNHYQYYGYGDGDDVFIMVANYGGQTFYDVSVPDDYTAPAYTTGGRPSLRTWETIGYSTSNVTHVLDRCMCELYTRTFTQNWVGRGYYEGPFVYSEYMDALAAEKVVCDSFGLPLFIGSPVPQGVIDGTLYENSVASIYMEPVDTQVKATYSSSIINDYWVKSQDKNQYVYVNTTGSSSSEAFNGGVDIFPSWSSWSRYGDVSHANSYLFYELCRRWVELYDTRLTQLSISPAYTDPRLNADMRYNPSTTSSLGWRDLGSNSIDYIENIGTDNTLPRLKNARYDVDIIVKDYTGIKSFGGDALGEMAYIAPTTGKLWQSNEYTLSFTFLRGQIAGSHTDPDGTESAKMAIAKLTSTLGDVFGIAGPDATDSSNNPIRVGESVTDLTVDAIFGGEVFTVTFVAFMDAATPKYRITHSRMFDSYYVEGVRNVEVPSDEITLAVLGSYANDGQSSLKWDSYGISGDEIIDISCWDRALSPSEMRGIEYYVKKDLPFEFDERFKWYEPTDYTPVVPATPSLVLRNSWSCDAIVGNELVDSVGGMNWSLFGSPAIENSGIALNSNGDYAVLFGSECCHMAWEQAWTISFQIKFKTGANLNTSNMILGKGEKTTNNYGWSVGVVSEQSKLSARQYQGFGPWSDPTTLVVGQWYHVVLQNDGLGDFKMYLDAVQKNGTRGSGRNSLPIALGICSTANIEFIPDLTTNLNDIIIRNITNYSGFASQAEVTSIYSALPTI